jgi:hypothetical protein
MNRVVRLENHFAVAIAFLCMLALTLCQILGPTARLNHSFRPGALPEPILTLGSEHITGAHSPLRSHCAAVKLVPVEIKTEELASAGEARCSAIPSKSTLPQSAELGVPTPPPRAA